LNAASARTNLGLGPFATLSFPGAANLLGSNGSAFTSVAVGTGLSLSAGTLSATGGGGGTPGGSNTQFQFNNSGAFGGSTALTNQTGYVGLDYNTTAITSFPAAPGGTVLRVGGVDATAARIVVDSFGTNSSHFTGECARGTAAAPTAIQANDLCSNFVSSMYNGAAYINGGGAFGVFASENQSSGHAGTYAQINTTPTGSATPAAVIRFENDGGVTVPSTVTGGDKGAGTINAVGLYVNGVAVGAGGGGNVTAGGTLTNNQFVKGAGTTNVAVSSALSDQTGYVGLDYNTTAITSFPAAPGGTVLRVGGVDATAARITIDSFGTNSSHFTGECARGTGAAPTAIQVNDLCSNFVSSMYNGTSYVNGGGAFGVFASENQSVGHAGTYAQINTTPTGSTTPAARIRFENDGGITVPNTVTGGDKGAGTINATGLYVGGVAVATSAGTVSQWTGTVAGTNTYTSTTAQGSFANTAAKYYTFCGAFANASTGASTLNLDGAGALPIQVQANGTLLNAGNGDIPIGNNCFQLDSSATHFVKTTPNFGDVSLNPSAYTVTAADLSSGRLFTFNTGTPTLTLPAASTISPNAGILIVTRAAVPITLAPNPLDGINQYAINTSVTIPGGTLTTVTRSASSGTGAWDVPLGPDERHVISWAAGQNLGSCASPPCGIVLVHFSNPRTVSGLRCEIQLAVGATATIDLVFVAQGTSLVSSPTVINTTACNANQAAPNTQNMGGAAVTSIPANSIVGLRVNQSWGSTPLGSGMVQLTVTR